MLQALLVKTVINQVMKAIEKASDKRIARTHDKRISILEKKIETLEKRSKK